MKFKNNHRKIWFIPQKALPLHSHSGKRTSKVLQSEWF
jgi:hypothetical protein